jgi:DNA-directed RNA polymerase subunit alpha
VERARIGQVTDYDRLVFEVTTDGTITPREALREAARILVQHFTLISGVSEEEPEAELEEEGGIPARMYETPIEELELTVRAYNCLKRAGITQVGEILEKLQKGEEEILAIRNFGQKSLDELMEKLRQKGFLDEMERVAADGEADKRMGGADGGTSEGKQMGLAA